MIRKMMILLGALGLICSNAALAQPVGSGEWCLCGSQVSCRPLGTCARDCEKVEVEGSGWCDLVNRETASQKGDKKAVQKAPGAKR